MQVDKQRSCKHSGIRSLRACTNLTMGDRSRFALGQTAAVALPPAAAVEARDFTPLSGGFGMLLGPSEETGPLLKDFAGGLGT